MRRRDIVNALIAKGYKAEEKDNVKNGLIVEGIVVKNDDPIAPIIYTDRLLEEAERKGKSLADVVTEVIRIYESQNYKDLDFKKFLNKDFVSEHIYLGLQKTSTEELIKENCFLDGLEVYLYIREDRKNEGSYTVKVTAELLQQIGMTAQEAWERARINTYAETEVKSLSTVIAEICGMPIDNFEEDPVYMVTNQAGMRGASAVLNRKVLEDIGQKHGTNKVVILPSSIHEVLVVPYESMMDMDAMSAMVTEVNATTVAPEEQLIDRAYVVDL